MGQSTVNILNEGFCGDKKRGLSCLPILQGAPATVGIPGSHTVAAAPPLVTLGHFHPQHLHV